MADKARMAVGPDGQSYQFPSDATDEEISGFLKAIPVEKASTSPAAAKVPTWVELGNDVIYGAAKGLANTTRNAVSLVPGVEPAARGFGNLLGDKIGQALYGTSAQPVSRDAAAASLEPTNTAQKVGKTAEQIGEFFVPAGEARLAATEGLARLIPNGASAATMRTMNKVASVVGRTIGEAGSAGTVAALQGDEHPGATAAMAGAGPLVGAGAGAATKLIKYPLTQNMIGILAGVGGSQVLGGLTPAGIGAGFGMYGLSRTMAKKLISSPGVIPKLNNLAVKGSEMAGRTLAAIYAAAKDEDAQ